ncbi:MAG TPA: acyltransferase [Crinalium sp.]
MGDKFQKTSTWHRRRESLAFLLAGSIPLQPGLLIRRLLYQNIFAHLGKSVYIQPGVEFIRAAGIEFGDRVKILRDVRIDCGDQTSRVRLGKDVCLDRGVDIKAQRDCQIEIGDATYIGPYVCIVGAGSISIGKDCLIASQSGFYANSHHFDDPHSPIRKQHVTFEGIVIEDDCWLGNGVRVLDGVTIGRGSVIGAGSVVTKNIPPYSVAVGVPARVISQRGQKAPIAS